MYSNEYMVTPEIRLFRENKDFRKEFYRFLYYLDDNDQPIIADENNGTNSKFREIDTTTGSQKKVPFTEIFKLITAFKKGTTCKDVMIQYFPEKKMGFDLFRLVSYLTLKGVLKRVHKYPVYPPIDESRFGSSSGNNNNQNHGPQNHSMASSDAMEGFNCARPGNIFQSKFCFRGRSTCLF